MMLEMATTAMTRTRATKPKMRTRARARARRHSRSRFEARVRAARLIEFLSGRLHEATTTATPRGDGAVHIERRSRRRRHRCCQFVRTPRCRRPSPLSSTSLTARRVARARAHAAAATHRCRHTVVYGAQERARRLGGVQNERSRLLGASTAGGSERARLRARKIDASDSARARARHDKSDYGKLQVRGRVQVGERSPSALLLLTTIKRPTANVAKKTVAIKARNLNFELRKISNMSKS